MLKNPFYTYGTENFQVPINLNFADYILKIMVENSDKLAFTNAHTHNTVTYGEIAQKSMSVAVTLSRMGLKKGQVVAICSENRDEYWPSVFGALCNGAIVTTMNVGYSRDEVKHVTSISKPKFIFCSPFAYKAQQKNLKTIESIQKVILFGDSKPSNEILYNDIINEKVNYDDFVVTDVEGQNDTLFILYSSGTTGLPKGVMLTHLNVLAVCQYFKTDSTLPELVNLTLAPWFHALGLVGTLAAISMSRPLIYITKFEEKHYLETIQRYKPEMLALVPPVLVLLTKSQLLDQYDVSSVNIIYCGAAAIDVETINDAKKRLPNLAVVIQGYGLTECTLAVTKETLSSEKKGTVGMVSGAITVKVVDVESRQPLGPNVHGEICVRGPVVMKGYFGKDKREDFDEEGFFKTGDIGYYDEDRHFYIVDRLKELIKYKGYQVAPAELEAVLLQHPAVRDAAVIGIRHKMAGEVPLAFIVKQPSAEVDQQELKDFIASKLSNPKHLRGGVRFIEEIPKNVSGKILRRVLKDMVKKNSKL